MNRRQLTEYVRALILRIAVYIPRLPNLYLACSLFLLHLFSPSPPFISPIIQYPFVVVEERRDIETELNFTIIILARPRKKQIFLRRNRSRFSMIYKSSRETTGVWNFGTPGRPISVVRNVL